MIIDNIDKLRKFIKRIPENHVIHICIIQRRKENPEMGSVRHIIKDYFIKCEEQFDKLLPEMIKIATVFNARIYFNPDPKSLMRVYKTAITEMVDHLCGSYPHPANLITSSVASQKGSKQYFIVDIDNKADIEIENEKTYLYDHIIEEVQTPNGIHLICNKFNTYKYNIDRGDQKSEIKKNSFTLLYYNGIIK